jgi:hypothetical protein
LCVFFVLAIASFAVPAFAQTDFAGVWASINNEDKEPRDPLPGEYAGIPLNEAGKMRASTWAAAIWQLPEWQCRPHPINYWARSPHAILIRPEINPYTREVPRILKRAICVEMAWSSAIKQPSLNIGCDEAIS